MEAAMFFQRIFTDGLAQASFLLGSSETREALVIDPRRDVDLYLTLADGQGLRITHVLETHIHADYASGARELADRTGASICLSTSGENDFPYTPLADGDIFTIGELRVEILHTPGHTPEHVSILVTDTANPDTAPILFSGDTLFVGGVGRPDLLGEEHTQQLARALYNTIHATLMALDDDVIVYPGHGAGSACGKSIGDAPSTTMGQEKRFNEAFRPMPEDDFVRLMLDGLPESPPYFPVMKRINKQGPAILGGIPHPSMLDVDALRSLQKGESTIVDVRTPEQFGSGFLQDALNIGLGPSLPNWAGWSVPYDTPIVLIVAEERDIAPAVTQLIRVGLDDIRGFAVANLSTWQDADLAVQTVDQLSVEAAASRIASGEARIIDVRNDTEWDEGHIPGAEHVTVERLTRGDTNGLDRAQPLITTCAAGYRSSLAASLLKRTGFRDVSNLTGGMDVWEASGNAIVRDKAAVAAS
jgi:hydroxyacylglutathione hydrolase